VTVGKGYNMLYLQYNIYNPFTSKAFSTKFSYLKDLHERERELLTQRESETQRETERVGELARERETGRARARERDSL
jgi:hypothetical protein